MKPKKFRCGVCKKEYCYFCWAVYHQDKTGHKKWINIALEKLNEDEKENSK